MAMTAKRLFGCAALLQVIFVIITATPASAVTSTSSPRAVGIRGYRRFHANDSYIGTSIPCTYEEKLCFRYNTLFSRSSGHCLETYMICQNVPEKQDFLHGSGHLSAVCPNYSDPCTEGNYRMAYDGRCYPERVVRDVLCGCGARPTPYFLGGAVECRCSAGGSPVRVDQPQEDGRCRIPDLRFPDNSRSFLYELPKDLRMTAVMNCTDAQAGCFSENKVAVRGNGSACHRLHTRGPCPPDHVVALDREALLASRAEGTCVHVRGGCPLGHTRMAFDGRCHKDRDIRLLTSGTVRMTADGRVVIDPLGYLAMASLDSHPENSSVMKCELTITQNGLSLRPKHIPTPPCAANDEEFCHLFEVQAEAPLPEFD